MPTIQNDVRKIPEPQRVSSSQLTEHLINTEKTAADYFSINKPDDEQLQNIPKDHSDHRKETVLQLVPDQVLLETLGCKLSIKMIDPFMNLSNLEQIF